jgi:maltose O-acetyltransferase
MQNTIILQIVNKFIGLMPLTRFYRIKAALLRLSGIECSLSCRIVSSVKIVVLNLEIGEKTFIGHQVLITGNSKYKIKIGNNVDIAPRVSILSGTHIIDMLGENSAGVGFGGNVIIENGVWIGANSTILPGVKIGKKAVIGAGSVVTKNIPPYCIAVGNPCRVVKKWNSKTQIFDKITE